MIDTIVTVLATATIIFVVRDIIRFFFELGGKNDAQVSEDSTTKILEQLCKNQETILYKLKNLESLTENDPQPILVTPIESNFERDVQTVKESKLLVSKSDWGGNVIFYDCADPDLHPEFLAANWFLSESKNEQAAILDRLAYVKQVFSAAEREYPAIYDFSSGGLHISETLIGEFLIEKKDVDTELSTIRNKIESFGTDWPTNLDKEECVRAIFKAYHGMFTTVEVCDIISKMTVGDCVACRSIGFEDLKKWAVELDLCSKDA